MKWQNILLSSMLVLLLTACNKQNPVSLESEKEKFNINVQNVIKIINENDVSKYPNEYNSYFIDRDYLYANLFNANSLTYESNLSYDLPGYNFNEGTIVRKKDDTLYVSIEGNDFCAIKDFNDSSVAIYNIDEKEKCHKIYIKDEVLKVDIISLDIESYEIYTPGTISNSYVKLNTATNLLDSRAVNYQWYRNGEKLEDGNVIAYTIVADNEDADYYVEVTTPNGDSYKSETINIKINRTNS